MKTRLREKFITADGRTFNQCRERLPQSEDCVVVTAELHPDTDPAAIAARHLDEVRRAVGRSRHPDAAAIAERLDLPLWNVRRHLQTLGYVVEDVVTEKPSNNVVVKGTRRRKQLREFMATVTRAVTIYEVMMATGIPKNTVRVLLLESPDTYACESRNERGARRHYWTLRRDAA